MFNILWKNSNNLLFNTQTAILTTATNITIQVKKHVNNDNVSSECRTQPVYAQVVYINYQKRRLQARVSASHSFNKLYDDTVPDTMTLTIVVWHESSAQSSTKP